MVDIDMPDVGSPLLEQINALGPLFGLVLIGAGVFLMLRGHERLQYVAGAVGGGIGYVFTPIVHDLIPDGTVSELSLIVHLDLVECWYHAHDHSDEHSPHGFVRNLHLL